MTLPVAVLLAGGLGSRLPQVSAMRPKPMADIEGRPFLEFVIEHLRLCGVREVILLTGYKGEVIERHFREGGRFGVSIRCVREPQPLGTAGALRLALPFLGERALVLNGDTYADVDVSTMLARHVERAAVATLAAVEREDASRFGRLQVDGDLLRAFEEKRAERSPGLVSAGVYVLERCVIEGIPAGRAVSFERETLPALLIAGPSVWVHLHRGYFEDIGVPESLAAFRAREQETRGVRMTRKVDIVRSELEESIAVKRRWNDALCIGVVTLADRIVHALRGGGKVVFFGNGGSAADAQHLAAELVARYRRERPAMRAIALNVNASVLTAIGNDYSYDDVFVRQVDAWVDRGDVVVGISTSGRSPNVVRALARAKEHGGFTVALTGEGGGTCAQVVDLLLAVPSQETPRIQESHITVGHILCSLVEAGMFEGP